MTTVNAAAPPALSARQVRLVVLGVLLGVLLSALDQTIVSTALPRVVADVGGIDDLPWVVTVYLLTSMATTPVWGKLADLYGPRGTFATAIGVFLVGSLLCGLAEGIGQLIAFRALQGLGGGGLFALALSIIGAVVPPADRGRYQGAFGAVFGLASVGGPVLGGGLADSLGWRWIFFVNLPVGLVSLITVWTTVRVPRTRRDHRIDVAGVLLILVSVTALLLYLNWAGRTYGWTAPGSLALLAIFVVTAAVLLAVESRASEPILPPQLFRVPLVRVGGVFAFLSGFTMFSGVVYLPVYLQRVAGMSAVWTGLAMLPLMLGIVATSMGSGMLISAQGRYKPIVVTGAFLVLLGTLALTRIGTDTPYLFIAVAGLVFGAGVGLTMQPVITAVQNSVPLQDIGAATGSVNFLQRMGSVVGTALLGSVLSGRLSSGMADALATVFLVAVPFAVLAAVVSMFLVEMRRPGAPAQPAADGD
ncbi:DHA2 family efflux MFS transporter permease subunit [Micromonospora haikouensis]|uniref:DHA2 family efflux MFS transporter permease subunit n=1 Tax=Micromonospora haikouensis TaxID=686309 RepID=UPI0037BB2E2C